MNDDRTILNNEQRYWRLVEAVADYMVTVHMRNGNVVRTVHSPTCFDVTGYTADEFLADPFLWINMVVDDDRHIVRDYAARLLRGESQETVEHRIRRKDGEVRWVEHTHALHPAVNGEYVSYDSLIRDVTRRRRAEEDLRELNANLEQRVQERTRELYESEQRYKALSEKNPSGILIVDLATKRFLYANPAICKMLGYSVEELSRLSPFDVHPPEWRERVDVMLSGVASGLSMDGKDWVCRRKDGRKIDVNISGVHLVIGGASCYMSIFQDVTRRKQADRGLRRAKAAAEEANRAKTEFLANMSHELRTPLGAVIGFSELLAEKIFGDLNAKQEEYVGDIIASGRHLMSLINDILDLAKIEAHKMDLEVSKFPVAALIEESLVMVKEKCLRRGISLAAEIGAPLKNLQIYADERKMKQVMSNLLSNAAKFTPDGGAITVSSDAIPDARQPAIIISVADTGIGIAKEHQPRIFDEFYQVKMSLNSKTPGTGLGLALVKRMVEQHGGRVWVESGGEGKGSTFSLTVPCRQYSAGECTSGQLETSALKGQDYAKTDLDCG